MMKQAKTIFNVVINIEQQYSIWPSYKSLPNGWENVGFEGEKDNCLDFIKKNWTDMRPASLQSIQDNN